MFESPSARAGAAVVLLVALLGLCVWFGALTPDPAAWALPDETELAADYDRYVGQRVDVGGTVVETDPVVIDMGSGAADRQRLTVTDLDVPVERGETLRVYGVAREGGTITAIDAFTVPRSGSVYTVTASFLAGLWVFVRIVRHWRVDRGRLGLAPDRDRTGLGSRLARLRRDVAGRLTGGGE